MWILDSLSEVQLKKPFLFLWIPLGAAFLLLAILFSQNPLYHPATYCAVALATWFCWQKERTLLNGLIVPAMAVAAVLMVPNYLYLYAGIFSLLTGKLIFAENFRLWKGIASTALLLLSFPILQVWQEIPQLRTTFPLPVTQLIHAAVFAFCIQFSLLPYQIRKDSVIEAFGHYPWKTSWHSHHLASETVALYTKIKTLIRTKESNPRIQEDLEAYTERAIHQCYRLQEITQELSNVSLAALEQQIIFLQEKLNSVQDFATRMQYEQALANKQKHVEQYQKLQGQQEHLLSRIINYNSSLENVRIAYANQDLQRSSDASENIEMFMDLVKARAEAI